MSVKRERLAVLVVILGPLLVACQHRGVDADPGEAAARLATQRDDVRAVVRDVLPALVTGLGGTVTFAKGAFEGCTTEGLEGGYRDFKYRVGGRIEASGPASLTSIATWLTDEGWQVGDPSRDGDRTSIEATRDSLRLGFTAYDAESYLLFGVSGECVDVPGGAREGYRKSREPDPDVLRDPA